MENDFDMKLYTEYLNGNKEAFEVLYNKYKERITYFVFNIVKDYQKAEDITQETFIYVLGHKFDGITSFKYHIYLVAKSRAFNYLKTEKRRNEISEEYLSKESELVETDIAEIVSKDETRKELIEAINELDEKYRNALYLNKIEDLTYKETAEILDETEANIKTLVHRGKKELRKKLVKRGFEDMNKVSKIAMLILCIGLVLTGVVYAVTKIIGTRSPEKVGKVTLTPTFTSGIGTLDENKLWVGTFNLVWNDLMDKTGGEIKFIDVDGKTEIESELADELNKRTFTKEQLSEDSYFVANGKASDELKERIANGIKDKFNEDSQVLDRVEWDDPNGYVLYAMLKKEFTFLKPFSIAVGNISFNGSEEKFKTFGVTVSTASEARPNVEILFYDSEESFAVKLKTNEGEEVILYKTTGEGKSFEENYQELLSKKNDYKGIRRFTEDDILKVPFIKVNDEINYDELCGKEIKDSGLYIKQALQTIDFELNNVGGSIKSEAVIDATQKAAHSIKKNMIFDSDFILYLKEEDKEKPYFALKVDNTDVLVAEEENQSYYR